MKKSARHSLVIPIYFEEAVLPTLLERLYQELILPIESLGDQVEVLFVNDGSLDRSAELLEAAYHADPKRVRVLNLSRNFGHQIAITAGLDHFQGDTVTVMDADLQDPPRVVLEMIEKWRAGADVVFAVRERREKESWFKLLTASIFYRLLRSATSLDIPLDTGDFRLMSRRAALALSSLREQHRFVRGLAKWVGFHQAQVLYRREARFAGETKYPFKKMLKLAWDAFTGFSLLPLRVATWVGVSASLLGLLAALWAVYVKFFTENAVQGWTSIMIAVLILGGAQLFAIGILGEYVGRIFEESKRRPLYVLQDHLGPGES
jgi:dolichol-phosphate mannosyltransferase